MKRYVYLKSLLKTIKKSILIYKIDLKNNYLVYNKNGANN
jgi:hypothetical protein